LPSPQGRLDFFAQCLQKADQGYAEAQSKLGEMILQGFGVAQDDTEAACWLRKAATQGHS